MTHYPQCDKAWKWPDFMGGRGIERKDCWMCGLLDEARAAALRDAVEAVKALHPEDHLSACGCEDAPYPMRRAAVAAIEALGGER